jgi:hypothetical protein
VSFAADTIRRRFLCDSCVITPGPSGPGTLNETTLAVTHELVDDLYAGPCKIEPSAQILIRPATFGQADIGQADLIVKLPAGESLGIRPGAIVTITASGDPELVDVTLDVLGVEVGTYGLTRRVHCRRRHATARTGGQVT